MLVSYKYPTYERIREREGGQGAEGWQRAGGGAEGRSREEGRGQRREAGPKKGGGQARAGCLEWKQGQEERRTDVELWHYDWSDHLPA